MARRNKPRHPVAPARPAGSAPGDRRMALFVSIFLVVMVAIVYGQTLRHDFINYDDEEYVTENPHVLTGLTGENVKWAFSTGHTGYAHPVTWLSHQIDGTLYGKWAGGHHLTSVIFHAVNAVLLFLFFRRTTRKFWASAFVAAIFAIHPLHVESVAWASERKDVLSGFFFLLTLHAYTRYAAKPQPSRYVPALILFALGILSKPMLVTVPCVLLLVDYWPLGRIKNWQPAGGNPQFSISRLVLEKVPFVILTIGWSATTYVLQGEYGALDMGRLSLGIRVANAFVSYGFYLWKTIWAHDLALFYPFFPTISIPAVLVSLAALVVISIICIARWKSSPPMIVGWLWYLGMLVPVIGFIQFGEQARADRYTYLPHIGLCVMVTFGILELSRNWRRRREILTVLGLVLISMFTVRGFIQTSYWRDSETLWNNSIAVTSRNYLAENNLGTYLLRHGRVGEAKSHFARALEIFPQYAEANNNMGSILTNEGKYAEATTYFETSLRYRPNHAKTHSNIGVSLTEMGRLDEAAEHFHRALQINSDSVDAHFNYARLLLMTGKQEEAVGQLREVIRLNPDDAEAKAQLRQLTSGF